MMFDIADKKTINRIENKKKNILDKLRYEIKENGYKENLGRQEAREFNDWVNELMSQDKISYQEYARYTASMQEAVLNL